MANYNSMGPYITTEHHNQAQGKTSDTTTTTYYPHNINNLGLQIRINFNTCTGLRYQEFMEYLLVLDLWAATNFYYNNWVLQGAIFFGKNMVAQWGTTI